jgi:glutathione S-transferase
MIKLYGAMASRAHRVVWMLKELGLPFEHIPTHFMDGSTRKPEYLAINPNGRVPALDDDGFVLFESLAITLYLAKKYSNGHDSNDLSPRDVHEEALAIQWSFWVATEVEKPLLFASANRALFAPDGLNEEQALMAIAKLDRPFKVLDAHLQAQLVKRPDAPAYVMGEGEHNRFTVTDLNIATVMDLAPQCGIALDAWPNVKAWHERCLARPAASDWKDVKFRIPRPPTPLGILKMFV